MKPETGRSKKRPLTLFALLFIMGLGVFLRVVYIDHNFFGAFDNSFTVPALDIVEGKELPLRGTRLGDFSDARHGPAAFYIFAIPVFFSRDPIGIFLFLALLNSFSIYIVFRIGNDFFSKNAGLIAALLQAVNPELVRYSRWIYDDGVTNIFVTLTYYFFFAIISRRDNRRCWIFLPVALAIGVQIHFQLLLILFLIIILLFIYKPSFSIAHFALVLSISYIALFPQIYHDMTHENSHFVSILSAILGYIGGGDSSAVESAQTGMSFFAHLREIYHYQFVLYLGAILFSAITIVVNRKTIGKWLNDENKKHLSLILFSSVTLLVFSQYHKREFGRFFAAYTPMTIMIGAMAAYLIFTPLKMKSRLLAAPPVIGRTVLIIVVGANILLQACLAFFHSVIYMHPFPELFSRHVGREKMHGVEINKLPLWLDSYHTRKKQYDVLLNKYRLDEETLSENIHGPLFYKMFGDHGYLFRTLPRPAPLKSASSYHYLMIESEYLKPLKSRLIFKKSAEISTLDVLQYKTAIYYPSILYCYAPPPDWNQPGWRETHWRRYANGINSDKNYYKYDANNYVWEKVWESSRIYFRGGIRKPENISSLLFVVELTYPDQNDVLKGPERKLDVRLFFNGSLVETPPTVNYKPYLLFGESYQFIFTINGEDFRDTNFFAFEINGDSESKVFNVDIYDLALK